MSTERQRLITVWIESGPWGTLGDLGTFEVLTGGNATSETTDYAPGGMAPRQQLEGEQTIEDLTVGRVFIRERDRPIWAALLASRGQARMSIGETFLDRARNPVGAPVTYTGLVGEVTRPDYDSESTDPARYNIVLRAVPEVTA